MKLYSGPLSLFTAKVRIALAEKGIDAEIVSVPFSRDAGYAPKHPDVLRHNPKAQVPVLVHGELALYDSTVILEYLEDHRPDPPLLPAGPVERARCRQLELEADELLFPHVWTLIQAVFYGGGTTADHAAQVEAAGVAIGRIQATLDERLDGSPYLCGESLTVADIGFALDLAFATMLGVPIAPAHARLQDWLGRIAARPAFATDLAAMQKYAAGLLA